MTRVLVAALAFAYNHFIWLGYHVTQSNKKHAHNWTKRIQRLKYRIKNKPSHCFTAQTIERKKNVLHNCDWGKRELPCAGLGRRTGPREKHVWVNRIQRVREGRCTFKAKDSKLTFLLACSRIAFPANWQTVSLVWTVRALTILMLR